MTGIGCYRQRWTAASPKAAILIVHGQGEHCGRYAYAAQAFNAQGYDVFAWDWPGHGRSPGLRGHIDRFDDYIDAVGEWLEEVLQESGDRPVFLLGHSVGGLIAVRYLQQRQADAARLAGVILSSPAFRLKYPIPAWKTALGRTLESFVPRLRMDSGLRKQRVTRNIDVLKATADDPLMTYVASIRFYNEMVRAQEAAMIQAPDIRIPTLLLHGGADEVIDPAASLTFGERISSPHKDIRLLPGLHHEIMNEPERDEVLAEMTRWLDNNLSSNSKGN